MKKIKEYFKTLIYKIILTWYCVAYFAILLLLYLIISKRVNINLIKAGGVELSFEQKSKDLGVYDSIAFQNVKNLNENQLKLFLIMGGDEAQFYRFTNTALDGAAMNHDYNILSKDSLLRFEIRSKDTTIIYPTTVGSKLHKALIQSIYSEIIK